LSRIELLVNDLTNCTYSSSFMVLSLRPAL
jgi:hypothetical protein